MFGLLGGLIGGALLRGMAARRPVAGALGGLLSSRRQAASPIGRAPQASQSGSAPQSPVQSAASPAPERPSEPAPPQAVATQTQPLVMSAQSTLEAPQSDGPLQSLLDDAPPIPAQPKPPEGSPPMPMPVVNNSRSLTPVARPADEQFGSMPMPAPTEMVDQISDSPPRLQVDFPDANPSRQPDLSKQAFTADQGYRYPATGGVSDSRMPFRYKRV